MQRGARAPLSRRSFIGGVTALPFWSWALAGETPPPSILYRREPPPLTAAEQVLNVMDFEPLAREALPPAHYAYLATGIDDDRTVALNQAAFGHYEIRSRRFADLTHFDSSLTVFGERWPSPLYLSAVSSMRAFFPEGEVAVARAARTRKTPLMLSSAASRGLAEVVPAAGTPPWMQLYATNDWQVTRELVRRAAAAGCPGIAVTLDQRAAHRVNETLQRAMRADSRDCRSCHVNNSHDPWLKAPYYAGLDVTRVTGLESLDQSPAWFDRLRALVKAKLMVKGIVTAEDAALAVEHGADAVIVSNHGGRDEETLRASIDCLPEVVAAVKGRVPVFVDGGIRRGTDIFKALALGATAVGIGRPYAWGVTAFGQQGVEAVIDILNRELVAIMRQAGTPTLADIGAARVARAART
jgi:(S)-2-hydroxy-acid oxidase